jgi:hypothetical protein
MDEKRLSSYRSIIHPIISIIIPFLLFWTMQSILATAIGSFSKIPRLFPLLLLAAGMAEAGVSNYLYKEKVGEFLPRLRELILILIISFFILFLLTGDLFRGNWKILRLEIIYPLVVIIFMWSFSYYVHQKLRNRELFLSMLIGVEEKDLAKTFREFHFEAGQSIDGIKSIRRLIIGFQIIIFVLVLVVSSMNARLSAGTTALILIHFAFGMIFFFSLNGFLQSQDLFGAGFQVSKEIQSRRFRFTMLVLVIGGLILVPIVREEPPLPASILASIMAWLEEKLTLPEIDLEAQKLDFEYTAAPQDTMEEAAAALGGVGKEDNKALQGIFRTIIIGLLIGLPAAAFLYVIIAPLFRKRGTKVHPLKAFSKWIATFWDSILSAIRNMGNSFKDFQKRGKIRRKIREDLIKERKAEAGEEKGRRAGFFRRLTQAKNIKAFLRLIRWGEKRGAKFQTYLGPKEYTETLGNIVPAIQETLVEIADLFEEQLFSHHEIDEEKNSKYFSNIRLVLKYR